MATEKGLVMIFKKYCSKHIILRLCLLIALLGSAAVFDRYYSNNQKFADLQRNNPYQEDANGIKMFFCNQVNSYNLKTPASEFSVRFKLAYTQDKFLLKHYNLRTFQIMKAESLNSFFPVCFSFDALPFNRLVYFSPDDIPPLA